MKKRRKVETLGSLMKRYKSAGSQTLRQQQW